MEKDGLPHNTMRGASFKTFYACESQLKKRFLFPPSAQEMPAQVSESALFDSKEDEQVHQLPLLQPSSRHNTAGFQVPRRVRRPASSTGTSDVMAKARLQSVDIFDSPPAAKAPQ